MSDSGTFRLEKKCWLPGGKRGSINGPRRGRCALNWHLIGRNGNCQRCTRSRYRTEHRCEGPSRLARARSTLGPRIVNVRTRAGRAIGHAGKGAGREHSGSPNHPRTVPSKVQRERITPLSQQEFAAQQPVHFPVFPGPGFPILAGDDRQVDSWLVIEDGRGNTVVTLTTS